MITRYTLDDRQKDESPEGEWVRFEDVKHLVASNIAFAEQLGMVPYDTPPKPDDIARLTKERDRYRVALEKIIRFEAPGQHTIATEALEGDT